MKQCKKLTTIAIIMKDGKFISMGVNEIFADVAECPRVTHNFETGKGYHLCKDVCGQKYHAEVDACMRAGEEAKGATLYLMGHTYCCESCKIVMYEAGIAKVVIADNDDSKRLDLLNALAHGYGTGWILRESGSFRGMRLHESTHDGGEADVRDAIDKFTNAPDK